MVDLSRFLAHGQAHMDKWAYDHEVPQRQVLMIPYNVGENLSSGFRDMLYKKSDSRAPDRPWGQKGIINFNLL